MEVQPEDTPGDHALLLQHRDSGSQQRNSRLSDPLKLRETLGFTFPSTLGQKLSLLFKGLFSAGALTPALLPFGRLSVLE